MVWGVKNIKNEGIEKQVEITNATSGSVFTGATTGILFSIPW